MSGPETYIFTCVELHIASEGLEKLQLLNFLPTLFSCITNQLLKWPRPPRTLFHS